MVVNASTLDMWRLLFGAFATEDWNLEGQLSEVQASTTVLAGEVYFQEQSSRASDRGAHPRR